jgi:hypothetical protein
MRATPPFAKIAAVRVASTGAVLDPVPITVTSPTAELDETKPGVVLHDGANWLVLYTAITPNQGPRIITATRVAPDGTVLDADGVAVWSYSSGWLMRLAAASDGTSSLVVFRYLPDGKLYGLRIPRDLTAPDGPFVINELTAPGDDGFSVGAGPDGFLVVWDEHPVSGSDGALRGCRISAAGVVLDRPSISIDGNVGTQRSNSAVAWDGTGWSVVYDSGYDVATGTRGSQDIYLRRISAEGLLSGTLIRVANAASDQRLPAIAAGPAASLQLVWQDRRVEQDIYTARVSAVDNVTNQRPVALSAPRQTRPRFAYGNGTFLMVFAAEVNAKSEIFAQRVDVNGSPMDPEPFWVSQQATVGLGRSDHRNPAVAFDGREFFVVWDCASTNSLGRPIRQVYGARFSPGAYILAPVSLMEGENADVAVLGGTYLTVATSGPLVSAIRARYDNSSGSFVVGQPVYLEPNSQTVTNARVAALTDRWIVVWSSNASDNGNGTDATSVIRGRFVTSTSLGSSITVSLGSGYERAPHIVSSGNEALVVWSSYGTSPAIKGRRVSSTGLLGAPGGFVVAGGTRRRHTPAVTWDGSRYIATWVDDRAAQSVHWPVGDIYGARIGLDETIYDPAGFVVANTSAAEDTPTIFSVGGKTLFAHSAFHDHEPFSAVRVVVRRSTFADLMNVTLPATAPRGSFLSGTVTLAVPAESGGAVVALQSQFPAVLSVPAQVYVPEGARTASFRATVGAATGNTSVVVTAKNAGISRTATVAVTVQSTFAQWQQAHFDPQAPNYLANSAAAGDPDRDGRSNLLEYATASDPNNADLTAPFSATRDSNFFTFTYTRRRDAADLLFQVQQSPNLSSWSDVTAAEEVIDSNGISETVRTLVPINGAPAMYLRLNVTLQN